MVCIRCQMAAKAELGKIGLPYTYVKNGEADTIGNVEREQLKLRGKAFKEPGLLVMDDRKSILVEEIKNAIIELVQYTGEQIKVILSDYLSEKHNYDYTSLAYFSEIKGITIKKFYLTHRNEKVKERIVYEELKLTQIAYKMHFRCAPARSVQGIYKTNPA